MNEPKHKTAPTMKMQAPEPSAPVEPPVREKAAAWHPMTDAPKDGSYLFLVGERDGKPVETEEWFWYKTRQVRKGTWQETGWWRRRFGANTPPNFTPSGYRRVSEGVS